MDNQGIGNNSSQEIQTVTISAEAAGLSLSGTSGAAEAPILGLILISLVAILTMAGIASRALRGSRVCGRSSCSD